MDSPLNVIWVDTRIYSLIIGLCKRNSWFNFQCLWY